MKKVIFIFAFVSQLVLAQQSQIQEELSACTRSCSQQCRDLAKQARAAADKFEESCGTAESGTQADNKIVRQCADSFIGAEDELRCSRSAQSVAAVVACTAGFVATSDELRCLDHAASGEVVTACTAAFIATNDELACLEGAKSADSVRACTDNFISTSDELACAQNARSAAQVRACAAQFLTPSDELNCIRKDPLVP